MLSPNPVIKVEDKFGACPTHTTKGQMMPLVIVVSNVSGCSATAGAPVFTVAKTGGMRSITPLAHLIRSFVGALHAFYSMKRPSLDVLSFDNLTESALSFLGYEPVLPHAVQFYLHSLSRSCIYLIWCLW